MRRVLVVLLLLVLIPLVWVGSVAARVWYTGRLDPGSKCDAILVMGAAQYNGTPSPVFEARLRKAQSLYQDGWAPRIITTGGKAAGDVNSEAGAGYQWLVDHGVPGDAVVPVRVGSDTWESVVAVAPVMREHGWASVIVVSDPYHVFRTSRMVESFDIRTEPGGVHSGPVVQTRETQRWYIVRETGAYVWWRLGFDATRFERPDVPATRSLGDPAAARGAAAGAA